MGAKLELLTDIGMHLFVERGIWGGISMVNKRYAKANNYDPNIMYLDTNNIYS